jgi:hypothetical protein
MRMKDNICFYLCSPTPSTTRSHTCACVWRITFREASNRVTWYPIHVSVAVIVPGMTSMLHSAREISKVTRNKRELRHIHVKKFCFITTVHDYLCCQNSELRLSCSIVMRFVKVIQLKGTERTEYNLPSLCSVLHPGTPTDRQSHSLRTS